MAFVIVMLATALSPDPGLETGEARLVFERFAFEPGRLAATQGTPLSLENLGAVPVTVFIGTPIGANVSFDLGPGDSRVIPLEMVGEHRFWTAGYEWPYAEVEVRSANPFTRFFEDLF